MECGALVQFGLGPDLAAMAENDPLYCGQADARPGKLTGPVQPLERREQFFRMRHVEARAVVADEENWDVGVLEYWSIGILA